VNKNAARILGGALVVGLLICSVVLVLQNSHINNLSASQEALIIQMTTELDSLRIGLDAQKESTLEVSNRLSSVEDAATNLTTVVTRLAQSDATSGDLAKLAAITNPALIAPGIYVLAPNEAGGSDEDAYTVYHVTATISAGDYEQVIQFGAAHSSLISWQFYFDYNYDGIVDTDMLREFVDSVPFGSYVSGSLDSKLSQAVYDRFLRFAEDAEYTPPDRIEEHGGEIAQQMWLFIVNTSEQLADWILGTVQNESPAGGSASRNP